MNNKKAFTMAEAILVMTILGIIATIMISTLKPAEFKEEALEIMAKKVLSEIDVATTQIIMHKTSDGTFESLAAGATFFNLADSTVAANERSKKLGNLYKEYLTVIRKSTAGSACASYRNSFYLKDGACIGISAGAPAANVNTIFPGEDTTTSMKPTHGLIFFDTNGEQEPNVMGQDQFLLPFNQLGIEYAK